MECPICYVELDSDANYTITSCKHIFCMKCFISSVLRNNLCPCCRNELYNDDENGAHSSDSDSSFISDEDPSSATYDDEDEDEDLDSQLSFMQSADTRDPIATIEEISRRVQDQGIKIVDLMHVIIPGRYPEYAEDKRGLYNAIYNKIVNIIERADFDSQLEFYERQIMESNDK